MDGADAVALLDSELDALLVLGQLLRRRRNPSIVDLRALGEQLGRTMTAVTEARRWASPDLASRLQVFLRFSEEVHRTLYPVRILSVISQFDGALITVFDGVRLLVAATVWAGIPGGNVA